MVHVINPVYHILACKNWQYLQFY